MSTEAVNTLQGAVALDGLPAVEDVRFNVAIGDRRVAVAIQGRELQFAEATGAAEFEYVIGADDWGRFTAEPPPRGYTTAQAMRAAIGWQIIEGDRVRWAQYAPLIDRIVEALRVAETPRPARNADPAVKLGRSQIQGGYVTVEVEGEPRRIYFESAGTGETTLLCLHTAGADSRQFRYLLEDEELSARYRVVAFDMPWHGRSDAPADWQQQTYRLTTKAYAATILAVMEALELDKPILMGCSMGGAIACYMASVHGEKFTASFALEGGLGSPGRFVEWTNHIQVDHSQFLASWVGGLIAPSSPTASRSQTLWGYAQSGPAVYQGDTYFYSEDFPEIGRNLKKATCPLWVFSGEYDYSATTEMSREAAERLGGTLVEMVRFGHFPMSEDPAVFRSYLMPVLAELEAQLSA
ncbi:MAG: alpha/beta hydrolase [Leucobacter sp.]|nr:alpha/beta hydrolase [Leucobacter sp.]